MLLVGNGDGGLGFLDFNYFEFLNFTFKWTFIICHIILNSFFLLLIKKRIFCYNLSCKPVARPIEKNTSSKKLQANESWNESQSFFFLDFHSLSVPPMISF